MKKIAILGTENSHALAFSNLLKNDARYADLQLIGIYGYDDNANKEILKLFPDIENAAGPHDFLGKADGIICTARHGTHHYEYTLPYIQAGIPCFIDKPFTVEEKDADAMVSAAKENGALLCGGSCLQFAPELIPLKAAFEDTSKPYGTFMGARFTAPVNLENPYGGFFFYTQHLLQMVTAVFGDGIRAVRAIRGADRVDVLFRYDGFDISGLYGPHEYSAALAFENKLFYTEVKSVTDLYEKELDEFAELMRGGAMQKSYESLAFPVKVLNALVRAYTEDREQAIV